MESALISEVIAVNLRPCFYKMSPSLIKLLESMKDFAYLFNSSSSYITDETQR